MPIYEKDGIIFSFCIVILVGFLVFEDCVFSGEERRGVQTATPRGADSNARTREKQQAEVSGPYRNRKSTRVPCHRRRMIRQRRGKCSNCRRPAKSRWGHQQAAASGSIFEQGRRQQHFRARETLGSAGVEGTYAIERPAIFGASHLKVPAEACRGGEAGEEGRQGCWPRLPVRVGQHTPG